MSFHQIYESVVSAEHLPLALLPRYEDTGTPFSEMKDGVLVFYSKNDIQEFHWITDEEGRLTLYVPGNRPHMSEFRFEEGYRTPLHRHDYIELGYVVEGSICQIFSGIPFEFPAGSFWLSDTSCVHQDLMRKEKLHTVFFSFSKQFFNKVFLKDLTGTPAETFFYTALDQQNKVRQYLKFEPQQEELPAIRDLIEQLGQECDEKEIGYQSVLTGLLVRLLAMLFREYRLSYTSNDQISNSDLLYVKILAYLDRHYAEVNLQSLADEFHYTTDFISRIIKRNSGLSYAAFIQKMRVEKAAELLRMTELPVEEIMLQVGYQNRSFFGELFKRYLGVFPLDYRMQDSR